MHWSFPLFSWDLLTTTIWTSRLPRWLTGKESTWQCRSCRRCRFDPCVGKTPWRRKWQPTPVFLPEESHGQRSLVCYSSQGPKRVRHDWSNGAQRSSLGPGNGERCVAKSSCYLSWQWADHQTWERPSQTIQPQPGQPPFRSPTQSNHKLWELTHAGGPTSLPLEWFGTQKKLTNASPKC